MTDIAKALKAVKTQDRQFNHALLQGVLEGFTHGILLLTEQGKFFYANGQFYQILDRLDQSEFEAHLFNQEIWRLYTATTKISSFSTHCSVIVESELLTSSAGMLHLEA